MIPFKHFFPYAALLSLSVLAAAVLAELGLRQLDPPPAPATHRQPGLAPGADSPSGFMRREERTGWFPREGASRELADSEGQSFPLRINTTGQRGGEVRARLPGERRILFLGDSFTMASQVPEEATFVARAESLLTTSIATATERGVRLINGGVNGYGTYQQLAYYRYFGRSLLPDVVVLCLFLGNDFRDNMMTTRQGRLLNPVLIPAPQRFSHDVEPFLRAADESLLYDPVSGGAIPGPSTAWQTWLQRRLLLARLLGSRFSAARAQLSDDLRRIDLDSRYYYYEIGLYAGSDDPLIAFSRELTLECLRQLHQLVRDDGAELLVALLPSQNQIDSRHWQQTLSALGLSPDALGGLDMMAPNRTIADDFCHARDIACLDLTEPFSVERAGDLFLTATGDGHFSVAGHTLAGDTIANFLIEHSAHLKDPSRDTIWSARQHAENGRWDTAERLLQPAATKDHPAMNAALAELLLEHGKWSAAEGALRRTLSANAESHINWARLGAALAHQKKRTDAIALTSAAWSCTPTGGRTGKSWQCSTARCRWRVKRNGSSSL